MLFQSAPNNFVSNSMWNPDLTGNHIFFQRCSQTPHLQINFTLIVGSHIETEICIEAILSKKPLRCICWKGHSIPSLESKLCLIKLQLFLELWIKLSKRIQGTIPLQWARLLWRLYLLKSTELKPVWKLNSPPCDPICCETIYYRATFNSKEHYDQFWQEIGERVVFLWICLLIVQLSLHRNLIRQNILARATTLMEGMTALVATLKAKPWMPMKKSMGSSGISSREGMALINKRPASKNLMMELSKLVPNFILSLQKMVQSLLIKSAKENQKDAI